MFCPITKNNCDQSCAFHVSQQGNIEVQESTCVIANAAHNIAEFPHWEIDPEELGSAVGFFSMLMNAPMYRKEHDGLVPVFHVGIDWED